MSKRIVTKHHHPIQRFDQTDPVKEWVQKFWRRLHIDVPLLIGLLVLTSYGLFILYSASDQNFMQVVQQFIKLVLAFGVMFIFAQIPPYKYKSWTPWIFGLCLALLLCVLVVGAISKGAQRWLNLGLFRFQPSEIMKLSVPMMLAWYLKDKKLPPRLKEIGVCVLIIIIPAIVTAKQPDLGTALIIMIAGIFVLLLAGIRWWLVISTFPKNPPEPTAISD